MKVFLKIFLALFLACWSFVSTQASFFSDFIDGWSTEIRYCSGDECWLDEWVELLEDSSLDVVKDKTFSEYIQSVVVYLLWFISLIAVIFIIYSGFQILIWGWDEEKVKKSRQTIIYVIIWIVIIWLAWPITNFIFSVLSS